VAAALRALGVESQAVPASALPDLRGAILIFIKTSRLADLMRARRAGNLLVLDVHDTPCFKRRLKNARLFHGMLFRNRRQLADFGSGRRQDVVIHHQWDPRYQRHAAGETELKPVYLGIRRSLGLWEKIPGVTFLGEGAFGEGAAGAAGAEEVFARAREFNAHLSLRETHRELLYKPGSKVVTAAACGAALLTTPDESAREMLGPDYPYYTDATLPSVLAGLENLRRTLGGPLWRQALSLLAEVRERTTLERIAQDYLDYGRRLEEIAG
jgi:hypothetical protein